MPGLSEKNRRRMPLLWIPGVLAIIAIPWILALRSQHSSHNIRISTGQEGGLYQPVALAIQEIVNREHPRLSFSANKSAGSVQSMQRLNTGECDFALLQNGTPGNGNVRAIASVYPEILHVMVPKKSSVSELRDLFNGEAQRKLAVGPRGSGTQQVLTRYFDHLGIQADDYQPVFVDMAEAASLLIDGEVDGVFIVAGIHAPAISRLMTSGDVRLLGAPEVEGFRLHYPVIHPWTIPVGAFPSEDASESGYPRSRVDTLAVPAVLVCSAQLDEFVVHRITRTLFENRTALSSLHPAAGQFIEPAADMNLAYPIHKGAEAYYRRDEPSFLVAYAEVMAFLMSVVFSIWGGFLAFRKWLVLRKKDRIDEYYIKIDEILGNLHSETPLMEDQLHSLEDELSRLRHKAVQELVREELIANESFRIFQTLLANSQSEVRRQLDRIESKASNDDA